jgi:transcriptional regulator with XRE-family HTH domain
MKPLHHALREARVRSGLTQTQAGCFSGIDRSAIGGLERATGASGATLKTLQTLAQTYGCTVSELIGEVAPADRRMNVKERRVVDLVLEAMRAE